ncbi:leucine-rich repeat serine/threonine-protein kinase 1-like isoform X2 [Rhopilema esculentum]
MLTASKLGMAEDEAELLSIAAIYDQIDILNDLLNAEVHGSVDSRDQWGLTPLHHAARNGSHKCVELLLQREADPDVCSHIEDNCSTPLHHAAKIKSLHCIQLLLDYDASLDVRNINGETAMDILEQQGDAHECIAYINSVIERRKIEHEEHKREELYDVIQAGSYEQAKAVLESLENKPDAINRYYRGPNTLLFKASHGGHSDVVELLLDNGANGRPNGGAGYTPLYGACYAGHLDVVKILVERLPNLLMQPTETDRSVPLHAGIFGGKIQVLKYLLSLRKKVDNEDLNNPPKRRSIESSRKNSAKGQDDQLKMKNDTSILDVNYRNAENVSALHLAVDRENKEAVLELLSCKPILKGSVPYVHPSCLQIDIPGPNGETPLIYAIHHKNVEIARMLLLNGADPNRTDPDSQVMTPIQTACWANSKEMVKLLLDHGANPNLCNPEKPALSPLCISCSIDSSSIVRLLLEFGAKDLTNIACTEAVKHNRDHIVELLLERGVFEETDAKLQDAEANFTSVRIIWNKRNLTELRKKWIVNSVVRKNMNLSPGKPLSPAKFTKISGDVVFTLVTKLDLSGNELRNIPVVVFQLPKLTKLTLSDNKIERLPCPDNMPKPPEGGKDQNSNGSSKSQEMNGSLGKSSSGTRARPTSWSAPAKARNSSQSGRPVSEYAPERIDGCHIEEEGRIAKEEVVCAEGSSNASWKWNCPLLEELEIHKNELTSLPTCLFSLPSLKVLNLCRNNIKELPLDLWSAPSLKDVLLQGNQLTALPSHPSSRYRQRFSKSDRQASTDEADARRSMSVDKEFLGSVKSKRPSWDGESSDESEEEEETGEKCGITKIDISDNPDVAALPVNLPCLAPNLFKLTAAGCSIQGAIVLSQLPPSLTMLDLSRNQITKVDLGGDEADTDRVCYSTFHATMKKSISAPVLQSRNAKQKRFCSHRSHRFLSNLRNLNLSQNNLESLVFLSCLKEQTKVETFDCVFPDLQTLNLANNVLKNVPEHIGKLPKLLCLDVSGNPKIDTLPPELGLCSQLYDLKFNAAYIRDPPRAIIEKKNGKGQLDVPYIRNFLKGVCKQSRPYPTIKLMLVGQSRKGKSTLLQKLRREGTGAFLDPEFPQRFTERMRDEPLNPSGRSNHNESTVGVDVCDWTYQRRQLIGGNLGPEIKFITWDFAGQDEYYATHTCFISRRAIYLLIWKLTDGINGIDQLQGWLLNIQARAHDSTVIIVGTHYDEIPPANRKQTVDEYRSILYSRYVSEKLGGGVPSMAEKGLPKVIEVTEVSSKPRSEHNIRELRHLIYDKALSLRDTDDGYLLEAPVPASYLELERAVLAIATRLRKQKKYPVLDKKKFKASVQEEIDVNELKNFGDDELDNAVKFLHDCGILLHFDGPALENLYFVDPQWLCDMLANVITTRDVNPLIRNGVLRIEDLKGLIFKGRRFSSDHVKKYIELMNKFEVALQISNNYLLVPSLLPTKQGPSPAVSSTLSEETRVSMKMEAYRNSSVFRRQYRMSYVPSGFWARLVTRLIADNRIGKAVTSCSELVSPDDVNEDQKKIYKESLSGAAVPEWACWRTGVELSCFGVKLLRVCQLKPDELFFGHDGRESDQVFLTNSVYKCSRTPIIEILVPAARLFIEVVNPGDKNEKTQFRVATVKNNFPQTACELLVLTAEHFDNLMTDWFPDLDLQNIHGEKSIQRIGLCPDCIAEKLVTGSFEETSPAGSEREAEEEKKSDISQPPDQAKGKKKKMSKGRMRDSKGGKNSKRTQESKKSSRKESTEGDYVDKGHPETINESDKNEKKGDSPGLNQSGESASGSSSQNSDTRESRRSASTESGERPGNENNTTEDGEERHEFENDPTSELEALAKKSINGFEFEEMLKKSDSHKDIQCAIHGVLQYERVFPDLVFCDLPIGMVFNPEAIRTDKFIAAGSYGAVFKAFLQRNEETVEVAVKVPNNTDAGDTRNADAQQDAEKNRKLKEGAPTFFTTGVYTTIRQELSILVPVSHRHVLDLIGVGLSPLRLIVEFATNGSLDKILSDYKKVGKKLDPYTMQKCIAQVSSALSYLHEQSIIYRDLKSENILVWSFPEPGSVSVQDVNLKLADYGISRAVVVAGVKGLIGTSGFIAPEIIKFRGKENYTKKVDVFSFGSFIYELITQELPFQKLGGGQADQMIAEGKRPRLATADKRVPVPVLSLLYRCWEQDPQARPSSSEIHNYSNLPEFVRLFDELECEDCFRLQCAVTKFKSSTNAIVATLDGKSVVGTDLCLLSNDIKQNEKEGRIGNLTVLNYVDGKCNIIRRMMFNDIVLVACAVGSTLWVGMKSGAIKVYCSMTYKPLALARPSGSGSVISMLHSPACNCVLVGLTNDSIMSYNENISSYMHTIPQKEVSKHFGNILYLEPIRELIANRVHAGMSIYNPIHCLAAVPSRARSYPIEEQMTYYGHGGEPLASSSRDHKYGLDDYMQENNQRQSTITYELWCGVDKGIINVFDLNKLEKVHILAATGCDIDNPTIHGHSVKCIETRRVFHDSSTQNTPSPKADESESTSVWVTVFPGTHVYRWNVDNRRLEAELNTLTCVTERALNSTKATSRQKAMKALHAQVNTIVVVENEVYIGTSFGCLIICESMSLTPLQSIRCYAERLDYIIPLQMMLNSRGNTGRHKERMLLCSGRACLDKWNKGKNTRQSNSSNCTILSWYVDRWTD